MRSPQPRSVRPRVLVVGAGVIGLTSAVRLREAGYDAHIWADRMPRQTTSSVAGAIWYPYRAKPVTQVRRWASATLRTLACLARVRGSGVWFAETTEILPRRRADPPWRAIVPHFRHARLEELPHGYRHGFVFTTALIDMPVHLDWLARHFRSLGGRIVKRRIRRLEQAPKGFAAVVNCAGLDAHRLVSDPKLMPIRGQIVRVTQVGLRRAWLDPYGPHGLRYIIPRRHECVLGGTAEDGDWSVRVRKSTAQRILETCAKLEPKLSRARVLDHRVGLRPGRTSVRLCAMCLHDRRPVVHNYGHGGSGVTISWACADKVVSLLERRIRT